MVLEPLNLQETSFYDAPGQWSIANGYDESLLHLGRSLEIGGEQLIGHTGTILGYSNIAMNNPERNYTIVVLSNLSTIDQTELLEELQAILLKRPEN